MPRAAELFAWLEAHAVSLDSEADLAAELLPRLAAAGLPGVGVAETLGGAGGDVTDGVEAIAAVSERSLAAGFVLWGHRTYIEYLLQSPNAALRERLLPDLLAGRVAGATGLSNAMKFLSGLAELQVRARTQGDRFVLDGKLPWVTNLRPRWLPCRHRCGPGERREPARRCRCRMMIPDSSVPRTSTSWHYARARRLPSPSPGSRSTRSGSSTWMPRAWLPMVRPAFLGLQCGMSIGLARRTLVEARRCLGTGRDALTEPVAQAGGDARRAGTCASGRSANQGVREQARGAVPHPHRTCRHCRTGRGARAASDGRSGLSEISRRRVQPSLARGRLHSDRDAERAAAQSDPGSRSNVHSSRPSMTNSYWK